MNQQIIKKTDTRDYHVDNIKGILIFLVVCAISVSFSRNLLNSILIFMSYSLVMSIIWILLESPDLAITEAAVVVPWSTGILPTIPSDGVI